MALSDTTSATATAAPKPLPGRTRQLARNWASSAPRGGAGIVTQVEKTGLKVLTRSGQEEQVPGTP